MSARRPPWVWWGAGALFLFLLAAWVYWASQRENRFKPLSEIGSDSLTTGATPGDLPPAAGASRTNPGVGVDPRLMETLQTVNEINRLNRINTDLRRPETRPSRPVPPLPPVSTPEQNSTSDNPQ